jgi:hypothetical protein
MDRPRWERLTREEQQRRFDQASALLDLDELRKYGIANGGPSIVREACLAVVSLGEAEGLQPTPGFAYLLIRCWNVCVEDGIDPRTGVHLN